MLNSFAALSVAYEFSALIQEFIELCPNVSEAYILKFKLIVVRMLEQFFCYNYILTYFNFLSTKLFIIFIFFSKCIDKNTIYVYYNFSNYYYYRLKGGFSWQF